MPNTVLSESESKSLAAELKNMEKGDSTFVKGLLPGFRDEKLFLVCLDRTKDLATLSMEYMGIGLGTLKVTWSEKNLSLEME